MGRVSRSPTLLARFPSRRFHHEECGNRSTYTSQPTGSPGSLQLQIYQEILLGLRLIDQAQARTRRVLGRPHSATEIIHKEF